MSAYKLFLDCKVVHGLGKGCELVGDVVES